MLGHDFEELPAHPSGARAMRFRPRLDGRPIPCAELYRNWATDAGFRAAFHDLLGTIPYPAYLWETPAVTRKTAHRSFEFVTLDSPTLARFQPDPSPFREHFARGHVVTSFESLGGDALLIAPGPGEAPYTHLAAFVAQAPPATAHALWRAVGEAMSRGLGDAPTWLSTSGLGVPWLHIRLDSRPKYYAHHPYRTPASP